MSDQSQHDPVEDHEPRDIHLQMWFMVLNPHALIYSTILLMTAYALYDEGTASLVGGAWLDLVAIGIAPLFALTMAHAFSDALDLQIRYGRRLNGRDRRSLLAKNLQYMYLAIPTTLILAVLTLLHWDANDAVNLILLIGLASLFFWGSFAARKARLGWGRQVTFGLSYGLMGFLVVIVELAITH